ncbi:benzyl alcohol O-benzoyltransferase [Senna tora]|uniref:Benzyl alcohol O-benzoyltransferase n=1 Tax=Senna tora TaxID=362788 RepID=A0A834WK34_9FABA|nr:benzyl alcohol O-benzoyltransferase [Senna tora]
MALQYSPSLEFSVRRREPELVAPAKSTPRELKPLSDIDDQEGHRFQICFIFFYGYDEASMGGKDPVGIIKKGVAETLVFYYPLAGRVREGGDDGKLMVDCNGEGILFIEADADVTLEQFGDAIHPPFPSLHHLLYDHLPGSSSIINSPLLLMQVTRLKCGGFILALRLNHVISDGPGLVQFLKALSQIANGAPKPSILPLWHRHLLSARNPPQITRIHHEYHQLPFTITSTPSNNHHILHRTFFFGASQIASLRRLLPLHLARSSNFDLIATCLWRCRTIALQPSPEDVVRLIFAVDIRSKLNPPLPIGYYGNGFVIPAVVTTAGKLCENPLGYGLELMKKAKSRVDEEYVRSVADLMVIKGRPKFCAVRSFFVVDVSRVGLGDVDIGWGKPVYGGPAHAGFANDADTSNYISAQNAMKEKGIVITISLEAEAMERFVREFDNMLNCHLNPPIVPPQIKSFI